jgi:hypothetical protein
MKIMSRHQPLHSSKEGTTREKASSPIIIATRLHHPTTFPSCKTNATIWWIQGHPMSLPLQQDMMQYDQELVLEEQNCIVITLGMKCVCNRTRSRLETARAVKVVEQAIIQSAERSNNSAEWQNAVTHTHFGGSGRVGRSHGETAISKRTVGRRRWTTAAFWRKQAEDEAGWLQTRAAKANKVQRWKNNWVGNGEQLRRFKMRFGNRLHTSNGQHRDDSLEPSGDGEKSCLGIGMDAA